MGAIWVGRHEELDVDVAIKFIAEGRADDSMGHTRFKREAKAAAKLKSPYVAQIHDYGVDEGRAYIAMELLEGLDLEQLLRRRKRMGLNSLVQIATQIGRGLSVAHETGIVHRDLKPANLFLTRSGDETVVKIVDFGIARHVDQQLVEGERTSTDTLVGSPQYMSPEQTRGSKVDHRSDLWSFACVLYEAMVSRPPFLRPHLGDLIAAICGDPIAPPSAFLDQIGPEIDAFFAKALSRQRADRYQSAKLMVTAFSAAVAEQAARDGGTLELGSPIASSLAAPSGDAADRDDATAELLGGSLQDLLVESLAEVGPAGEGMRERHDQQTEATVESALPPAITSPGAALSSSVGDEPAGVQGPIRGRTWFIVAAVAVLGVAAFMLRAGETRVSEVGAASQPTAAPTETAAAPATPPAASRILAEPTPTSQASVTSSAAASAIVPRRAPPVAAAAPRVPVTAQPESTHSPPPARDPIFGLEHGQ